MGCRTGQDAAATRVGSLAAGVGAGALVAAVLLLAAAPALGQASAAPTITSPSTFAVDEGTTSVATLTASDQDTATADLTWSKAGGADADDFTVSAAGVLAFGEAKDFEKPDDADADGAYEITVQVSDGDNDVTADLTVTLGNVIELETMSGPAAVSFAENGWGRVATFTASSDADRDGIIWVLGGDDAAHFSIDNPAGALRFDLDKVPPAVFPRPPDFEAPVDDGADNTYEITVQPTTSSDNSASATAVTVTVTDEDEPGSVTLSAKRPRKGAVVTATLTDPDGVTSGSASWTWERTDGKNSWVVIPGAGSASYTPGGADAGSFLRASVTYTDGHGAGAQASATTPEAVAAARLSSLSVSTDDSATADAWRKMRPAFDASILHYSVGCNSSDTMTLTIGPADGSSRISVDGTRIANPGAGSTVTATRAVSGDSVVRIALTGTDGARTHYAVHCLADDITKLTVSKPLGESQVLDELILYTDRQRLMIVDSNGVPRVVHRPGRSVWPYFRFYADGGNGVFRYSYNGEVAAVLDENLDLVAHAWPAAPLTQRGTHDFRVLENGNLMLMAYQEAERDLSSLTLTHSSGQPYTTDMYVEDSAIQIVTPGGRAVFNWNSWDHMPLEDCTQHFFPPADGDYAHVNSTQLAGGLMVASMRGCSRVLGIDARTGEVAWRVGPSNLSDAQWAERRIGPAPLDIIGDPEKQFCGQHAAALVPDGNLILYDNGVQCTQNPWTGQSLLRTSGEYSRGVEYALDLANGEAVFVRDHSLGGAESELGYLGGNIELLGNGHWLISWGGIRPNSGTTPPSDVITQVDPDTGREWLKMDAPYDRIRGTVMPPHALAANRPELAARFVAGSRTSVFHSGASDDPTVLLAFNRPVADFAATSPSLRVTGASVASVAPLLVAGAAADSYLVTLEPAGSGAITVQVRAGQACSRGGICTADGTVLSAVPDAAVISPPITVSFSAAAYRVSEGRTLQVPVVLSHAHGAASAFELPITASLGSASDDDFSAGASVSVSAGERSATVAFDAGGDDLVEGSETIELGLGTLPAGFTAGSRDTTTVTIADADSARFEFTAVSGEVSEGGETSLRLAITNGVAFAADETVDLAVSGSAVAESDFVLVDSGGQTLTAPYTVTLAAGEASVAVTLRAVDDADAETTETVTLRATLASTGEVVGSAAVALGPSDLGKPEVTVSGGAAVTEGGDAVFTLSRTATTGSPLSQPLTVPVQVTAPSGVLGGAAPSSVTFGAGESTEVLRLATVNDKVVGDGGEVAVLVRADRSAAPAYTTGSANRATVAVQDDDTASFTVSSSGAVLTEGDTATVTVSAGSVTFAQAQTLDLSVTGTAADGEDFVLTDTAGRELAAPYRLVIGAGAGSTSLKVSATLDYDSESGETVVLSFRLDGAVVGSMTVTLADVNQPPTLSGRDRFHVAENDASALGTFTATDPEGGSVSWALAGDDRARFSISGGTLRWITSPDFEAPADNGVDNVYDVTVEASDSSGGTTRRAVAVTVTDVDEPAAIASASGLFVFSYSEHATTQVAAFTASDPERAAIRWSLGGDDLDDFEIDGGVLRFVRPPDYEHPSDKDGDNRYDVRVLARAGASVPVAKAVTVNVTAVDEPGVVALSSPQPQVGTALQAAVTDPDGTVTSPSWTWQRSADGISWSDIAGASTAGYTPATADVGQRLRVQVSYTLGSSQNASASAPRAVRAAPAAPNGTPSFATGPFTRPFAENAAAGAAVGAPVAASDPDNADSGRLVYSLSGTDAARFNVDRSTGQIRVGPRPSFDYETGARAFSVTVTAADPSGASATTAVAVALTDANDSPVAVDDTAATLEDAPVVIDVGANDTDPDGDTLRFAVRRAPRHGSVRLLSDMTMRYTPSRDFNGRDVFTYTASDGARSDEAVVIVTVSAVNDQPKFPSARATRSVADGARPGSAVGRAVRAADTDGDPLAYRLFDVDAPFFSIDYHTGEISVGADTVIDRAVRSSYRLRVQANDPSGARVASLVDIAVTANTGTVGFAPTPAPEPSTPVATPTLRPPFVDTVGLDPSTLAAIAAIAQAEITIGCNPDRTRYCPHQPVTRSQMALFLTRALKLPTPTDTNTFHDTTNLDPSTLAAIAAIADAEITIGCNPDRTHFCPHQPVTRSQMALFLARALKLPTPTDTNIFDDTAGLDPSTLAAIAAIAQAEITIGCNPDRTHFCPHQPVTRSQMALFLARALKL